MSCNKKENNFSKTTTMKKEFMLKKVKGGSKR
jgi:hypothetical protein